MHFVRFHPTIYNSKDIDSKYNTGKMQTGLTIARRGCPVIFSQGPWEQKPQTIRGALVIQAQDKSGWPGAVNTKHNCCLVVSMGMPPWKWGRTRCSMQQYPTHVKPPIQGSSREGKTGGCHHSPDKPRDDEGKERRITPIRGLPILDAKPDLHRCPPPTILLPHLLAPTIFSVAAIECKVLSFPIQLDQMEL